MKIPETDKEYNHFDDGKIGDSRRTVVLITEIIEFENIDDETLKDWKNEQKLSTHLYKKETDYFVKGILQENNTPVTYVRTRNNEWFSLGTYGGLLDVSGEATKRLNCSGQCRGKR